jgi:hypothetical protein
MYMLVCRPVFVSHCCFVVSTSLTVCCCLLLRCFHPVPPFALQFWVYSMYEAFRSGKTGVRPMSGASLAAERGGGGGKFTCIPNKIKF